MTPNRDITADVLFLRCKSYSARQTLNAAFVNDKAVLHPEPNVNKPVLKEDLSLKYNKYRIISVKVEVYMDRYAVNAIAQPFVGGFIHYEDGTIIGTTYPATIADLAQRRRTRARRSKGKNNNEELIMSTRVNNYEQWPSLKPSEIRQSTDFDGVISTGNVFSALTKHCHVDFAVVDQAETSTFSNAPLYFRAKYTYRLAFFDRKDRAAI